MNSLASRTQLLCVLILLAGLASISKGQILPLKIAFPAKSHAEVSERMLRSGKEWRLKYDLDVETITSGKFRAKHSNARFIELQERPMKVTEHRFPDLSGIMGKSAVMEINAKGEIETVINLEEIVAGWEASFKKDAESNQSVASKILGVLSAEDGKRKVTEFVASSWGMCFKTWIDWDLKPGEEDRQVGEMEHVPGVSIRCEQIRINHGKVSSKPLLWHLSVQTRVADDDFAEKIIGHLRALNPDAASKLSAAEIQQMNTTSKVEGYIDPMTLRPHWIKVEVRSQTSSESDVQEFEYEFKWSH